MVDKIKRSAGDVILDGLCTVLAIIGVLLLWILREPLHENDDEFNM